MSNKRTKKGSEIYMEIPEVIRANISVVTRGQEIDSNKISAYINGKYYPSITRAELNVLQTDSQFSSGAQSNDRRRQYEDLAQDTVQPYDAGGNPRPEFYRLYPTQAAKVFTKAEIEQVKRKL